MSANQKLSDSFKSRATLNHEGTNYTYFSLPQVAAHLGAGGEKALARLPFSLRVLLENLLRSENGVAVQKADIDALLNWKSHAEPDQEIQFTPARVVLQDFTGVPCIADLAAMRDALKTLGGDPKYINPLQPADLVIDHSVQMDFFGTPDAADKNSKVEFQRNQERYAFLRWGQTAFRKFRVVPPDTGIVHQVNIEHLAPVAMVAQNGSESLLYPDTVVGTDSHTTMVNGLGVLGWGVGGIEAEAAMLGQPISMLIPQVVGFRLTGKLPVGATATDLVLTVTQILRKRGVVGKFVEFFGNGLRYLSLSDRATIANMAPEYGATCGLFPVDEVTLEYLRLTGRPETQVSLVESYYKAQGLFFSTQVESTYCPDFSDVMELDLSTVKPCLAGPSRPQDRVLLADVPASFKTTLKETQKVSATDSVSSRGIDQMSHGDVVIAAITSCTNTSNPAVLIGAGLLAKKAVEKGLKTKPWVKTTLAPGSKAVSEYLSRSGLLASLEQLGFHIAGFGCATCIGNSGPLPEKVSQKVKSEDLVVSAVLSGNRNFEGRVHPQVRANYLASPPLVVAYALAGSMNLNLETDALGVDGNGKPVLLSDIWPSREEIQAVILKNVKREMFEEVYAKAFEGDASWQGLKVPKGDLYAWDEKSTYIKRPPFFDGLTLEPKAVKDIAGARLLAVLGDSVTTDHISPAGDIAKDSPAAKYLESLGVSKADFNSYGARRGNHEVMMRGTFANIRLKNLLVPGTEGNVTVHIPTGAKMPIFDAAMKYQAEQTPLLVVGGKEYGTGSSRDWAAKGTLLLGVRAVLVESFERIHRNNLVGMGVLPLQFLPGENRNSMGFGGALTGQETFDIKGLAGLKPGQNLEITIRGPGGQVKTMMARVRIDTLNELEYFKNGGILQYVLRTQAKR